MNFWQAVGAIVWKDIRAETRTKDIFSSMFVFALLSVIVFNFAFQLRVADMKTVVPGIVWVAISFAGTLGLNRAFVIEMDKGSLAGLLLAPMDRAAIYFGKTLGNLLVHADCRGCAAATDHDLLQSVALHACHTCWCCCWARSALPWWARSSRRSPSTPGRVMSCCRSCSSRCWCLCSFRGPT